MLFFGAISALFSYMWSNCSIKCIGMHFFLQVCLCRVFKVLWTHRRHTHLLLCPLFLNFLHLSLFVQNLMISFDHWKHFWWSGFLNNQGRSERSERSPILLLACRVQLGESCQNGRERSEPLQYESLYLGRAKRASIHLTIEALRQIHAVSDAIWFLCKCGRWGRTCDYPRYVSFSAARVIP